MRGQAIPRSPKTDSNQANRQKVLREEVRCYCDRDGNVGRKAVIQFSYHMEDAMVVLTRNQKRYFILMFFYISVCVALLVTLLYGLFTMDRTVMLMSMGLTALVILVFGPDAPYTLAMWSTKFHCEEK